jgi:hypothetical protein
LFHLQAEQKLKTNTLFPRLQKYQDFQSKLENYDQNLCKNQLTRGVKDFISSVGWRLVSGNCHEPDEPISLSHDDEYPPFLGGIQFSLTISDN